MHEFEDAQGYPTTAYLGGIRAVMEAFQTVVTRDRGVTDDDDLRPSSSRVKKVLNWDGNKFTMDERHKRELRDHHIKD